MSHLREHWEGVSIAGNYTLEQWVGGDDSSAFFQTSLALDGRRAVVKLIPEPVADNGAQLDLWHRIRQLRHPNLIELLDFGRADHGGESVLYAVFEAPDDTLAAALTGSPLNQEESREVLDSIRSALQYLHAQGLVLGALDPDRIVAVGDRIKLATDALRDADTLSTYSNDIALLGRLWQQALMAATPKSSELAAHAADPEPNARWTLAQISAALDESVPALPPPAAPSPIAVSEAPAVVPDDEPVQAAPRRSPEIARTGRFPKWVIVATAALVALILWLNRPRTEDTVLSREAPVSRPVLPVKTPSVGDSLPRATPSSPERPVLSKSTPGRRETWRVIAFTYRSRTAADKKVKQLNEQHPDWNAAVFSPDEGKGYYLVSLGGGMTREEALRLQRNARQKGLPRDLFVQNYSR
jgi:eukaryotic-like serine/threonine-protein kinase